MIHRASLESIVERIPATPFLVGNGSWIAAITVNLVENLQRWATLGSVLAVVALNVSMMLIAWRRDRREAAAAAAAHLAARAQWAAAKGCGRSECATGCLGRGNGVDAGGEI